MRRLRDNGYRALIEAAARKLIVWHIRDASWQHDSTLKRKLAEHLRLVIARKKLYGYQEAVRSNWVTRHQVKIDLMRIELASVQNP